MPIKQTVMTEDGHCFNGYANTIKGNRNPKERALRSCQGGEEWAHWEVTCR